MQWYKIGPDDDESEKSNCFAKVSKMETAQGAADF